MYLENFSFLAADTSRSLIYLEEFKKNNIKLGSVIILENPDKRIDLKNLIKKLELNKKIQV